MEMQMEDAAKRCLKQSSRDGDGDGLGCVGQIEEGGMVDEQ